MYSNSKSNYPQKRQVLNSDGSIVRLEPGKQKGMAMCKSIHELEQIHPQLARDVKSGRLLEASTDFELVAKEHPCLNSEKAPRGRE